MSDYILIYITWTECLYTLYLPEYNMTYIYSATPSQSSVIRKVCTHNMFNLMRYYKGTVHFSVDE